MGMFGDSVCRAEVGFRESEEAGMPGADRQTGDAKAPWVSKLRVWQEPHPLPRDKAWNRVKAAPWPAACS